MQKVLFITESGLLKTNDIHVWQRKQSFNPSLN